MATAAAAAAISKPLVAARAQRTGPIGANDRVRMAVIGAGNRANEVMGSFASAKNTNVFVAACDVFKERLDAAVQRLSTEGSKVDAYGNYRRVLDRNDIDGVLLATPDHWHPKIAIDACAAGKDVYMEKPTSNDATLEEAAAAIQAARRYNRIVQVGTQQRSWPMFGQAREVLPQLGGVTHVVLQFSGGGSPVTEAAAAVPAGLDWDMFQGPAPHKPYKAGRHRGWRYYLDYGGGLMTDWGVHLTDTALWFMDAQLEAPKISTGVGQYVNVDNPDRDRPHNAFTGSWQYSKFVMTFSNVTMTDPEFPVSGTVFYGPRGALVVNRQGYMLRPSPSRGRGAGPVGRGGAQAGRGGAATPGAAGQGRGRAGGAAAAQPALPPLEGKTYRPEPGGGGIVEATTLHVDNFLDCMKSRQKPVSDIEIGFFATLPCVLALRSMREGRAFTWDAGSRRAKAL
jgi:predicted dehydrogenase